MNKISNRTKFKLSTVANMKETGYVTNVDYGERKVQDPLHLM
jgi:ribosomal protein S8